MAEENEGEGRSVADDVIFEILKSLPSKSLLRFKCVCKTWYDLILSPYFVTNHFDHNRNRLLAIHDPNFGASRFRRCFTSFLVESPSVRMNIDNPLISNGRFKTPIKKILGPVKGLYFIHYYSSVTPDDDFIAFWNPSTSEFRRLDFPSLEKLLLPLFPHFPRYYITRDRHSFLYDFGFGSTDDDIKLVCRVPFRRYVAFLYSLANDCWTTIKFPVNLIDPYSDATTNRYSTYMNGVYYWLVKENAEENGEEKGDHLLLFDMRTEVFGKVLLPAEDLLYRYRGSKKYKHSERILVRNDRLILCVSEFSRIKEIDCVDIWELKEDGCWNKILSFAPPFSYSAPLRFWKDDEIIFRANDWKLVLYNIHSNGTRNLGIEASIDVLEYEVSFTSVKGGKRINSSPPEL